MVVLTEPPLKIDMFLGVFHYCTNLNRGGQKALTEAVFATTSVLPVSVNRIKNKKRKTRG
jgi:hypothetical protein